MYRRAILATAATTAATAAAGCVGAGGTDTPIGDGDSDVSGDDESGAGTPSSLETAADPDLRSTEIVEVDPDATDDTAVSFAPDAVHVAGAVVGETGCHGVEVADAAVNEEGEFRVVVAAVDESEPGAMCTQALTTVGYELDATFDDGVPVSVTVTHDDAHGQETAASERPNAE